MHPLSLQEKFLKRYSIKTQKAKETEIGVEFAFLSVKDMEDDGKDACPTYNGFVVVHVLEWKHDDSHAIQTPAQWI